jgi:hypothetical protein
MNMQFVDIRKNNSNPFINYQQNYNPLMPFTRKFNVSRTNSVPQIIQEEIVTVSQNNPNKIKWGPPTWYLFHTIAHKVKDDSFIKIRYELLNNIIAICRNLPCPKCSAHATDYMSKINLNSIRTKDDLKMMLFNFHNEVNSRTGAVAFSFFDLNNTYDSAITINIIQNFFLFFRDKTFNVTSIANTMHRERLTIILKDWFIKNINNFDP